MILTCPKDAPIYRLIKSNYQHNQSKSKLSNNVNNSTINVVLMFLNEAWQMIRGLRLVQESLLHFNTSYSMKYT